jgi:hypothetical protein
MPKAQAARTFSVSLSSVKRYVNKEESGIRSEAGREGDEARRLW